MRDEILNEITLFCMECGSKYECPEDDCVLFRIERIVTENESKNSRDSGESNNS